MTTTIDALPAAPSRASPTTFPSLADALVAALQTFVGQANTAATEINASNSEANNTAVLARALVNAATIAAGVGPWVSGTTYVMGQTVYSAVDLQTYRRKANGAGTTDPSSDATNWTAITADLTNGPALSAATVTDGMTVTGGATVSGGLAVSGVTALGGAITEKVAAMAANDIDVSAANYFTKTITADATLTVSNVPATGSAASFYLELTNGGSQTLTWWAGLTWAAGAGAPALSATGIDVLAFFTRDGGTTWTGAMVVPNAS